ncbi:MAG TPA: hypothetical protein VFT02_07710 [Pyrinomonadaceae bacterium]|nr:hypothetical protein [Pyrinomonadaceae bacterium]
MQEARNCASDVANALCDAWRQIGDVSYAILPKDVAHAVGDLNKAILSSVRSALECQIYWIDDRVAGGDRLREEWRAKCRRETATADTIPQPDI